MYALVLEIALRDEQCPGCVPDVVDPNVPHAGRPDQLLPGLPVAARIDR